MRGGGLLARLRRSGPALVSAAEAYARWAPVYPARPHNPLMEAEAAVMRQMIGAAAPRRALDVGTGTGRNLEVIANAGAMFVAGIDLSAPMLANGTSLHPRVRGNACRLPFRAGAFDLVTSSLMCGDVPDLHAWVAEGARVLARGGHLVYSDFHPSWTQAGWRRTFTGGDGRAYELPFHPHRIEDHLQCLEECGMEIRAIREPRISPGTSPVVVVLHAVKSRGCR